MSFRLALELADSFSKTLHEFRNGAIGFIALVIHPGAPAEALEEALLKASQYTWALETACIRREPSITTLRSLLQHPDPEVAQ